VRLVTVDLDDAAGLERLWSELRRHRAIRAADPPLRRAILRRAERLTGEAAKPILDALDELHPAVVLEAHFTVLVPDFPTVGFYGRQSRYPLGRPAQRRAA
jgi:hypothetical protein